MTLINWQAIQTTINSGPSHSSSLFTSRGSVAGRRPERYFCKKSHRCKPWWWMRLHIFKATTQEYNWRGGSSTSSRRRCTRFGNGWRESAIQTERGGLVSWYLLRSTITTRPPVSADWWSSGYRASQQKLTVSMTLIVPESIPSGVTTAGDQLDLPQISPFSTFAVDLTAPAPVVLN